MIKKFNNFLIKESSEVEDYNDIRDIFSDMTDEKFQLNRHNQRIQPEN